MAMRKFLVGAVSLVALSGCLGNRPTGPGEPGEDAGVGGAGGSSSGAGGAIVDAGRDTGRPDDAGDARDAGSGGVTGTGTGGYGPGGQTGTGGAGVGGGPGGAPGTGGMGTGGHVGTGGMGAGGTIGGVGGVGVGGHIGTGGMGVGGTIGGVGGAGVGGHIGTGGMGVGGTPGTGGMIVVAAALSGSTSTDFASLQIGATSAAFTWPIQNATGAMSSGTPSLTNNDPAEVSTTNNCSAPLAGGASCTISVTFKPNAPGARSARLTLTASPGGTVTLTISATGTAQVTVTTVGTGTVTSAPAGISCPGTCTASFSTASVTLQARTTNGSNSFFSAWSDSSCPGPFHDCVKNLTTGTVAITATFSAMNANLIFGTLETFATDLGGTAPYDKACNSVATAAGLNNSAGNGYIAMISDANSSAISRLGTARGWVRLDGKPFADTQAGLFSNNQIFYPFVFQEDGMPHNGGGFITATSFDGTALSANCSNWTNGVLDTNTIISAGTGTGGPGEWLEGNGTYCGFAAPLICMGKSKSVAVTAPTPGAGRKIWVSSAVFTPNATTTPDSLCQTSRPAGVTTAVALISTTTKAAASVLVPTTSYFRIDGTLVGTGTIIAAMGAQNFSAMLTTGVWQSEDGVYQLFNGSAWTGSDGVSVLGTPASTCGNWTDTSSTTGTYGLSEVSSSNFWNSFTVACTLAMRLYCVQTVP